jgi:ATP-binding cassette subfamily F protein 1
LEISTWIIQKALPQTSQAPHLTLIPPLISIAGKVTADSLALAKNKGAAGVAPTSGSGLVGFESKVARDSMGRDIQVENITIAYQGKELLKETDLRIAYGHKYGVIGPNGTGKSTLLRHISGRELPIQDHIRILHVEQEAEASDRSALLSVLDADTKRSDLLAEEAALKALSEKNTDGGVKAAERLIEVYAELRAINAYSAEARAGAILSGLQFTEAMKQKATKEFSGGWRMRIALARALFLNPDLLILDEPTNHLDLNAVIWLEAYLHRWKKTLLVVSHDRDFLNYFVTDIIHLNKQKLNYYKGNYDTFERTVLLSERTEDKARKKEQKTLDAIHKTQTTKGKAEKAKMESKGLKAKKEKAYEVEFNFPDPGHLPPPVIAVSDASFTYDTSLPEDQWILKDIDHHIDMDSRIAIVGPNGAGKSTFINMVLGELEPTRGEVVRNRKLRTIKFAQHFVDELEMAENALAYIQKNHPDMDPQDIRNRLGMFGLTGKTHTNPIALLSGGQKSRVMFTNIAITSPHIMFLDEPTNHLDMQSVDALADGLQQFPGGIVLISHDQRLLTKVCDVLWIIDGDQQVRRYEGTFEEYRQELIDAMDDSIFEELEAPTETAVAVQAAPKKKGAKK